MGIFKFCIQNSWTQVCLQQSCNSIKSSVPSDNISLNRRFFSQDWAPFACSIVSHWVASCLCLCWHNAAGNSQMGSFLQPNLPQWISMSLFGRHLLLCIVLLSSAFSCLKAYLTSNCSFWIMSLRLISLTVSQLEGFLLTSRPSWSQRQWRPSCAYKALYVPSALPCAAPDVCSRSSAAW